MAKRKKNPVGMSNAEKVRAAKKLFKNFRLSNPDYIDELDVDPADVCMAIGECDGILYTTVRDGKEESYIHEFNGKSRPTLAASYDGKQLFLLGGDFKFGKRGIVDKG